jgi:hypothetical protein
MPGMVLGFRSSRCHSSKKKKKMTSGAAAAVVVLTTHLWSVKNVVLADLVVMVTSN